MLKVALPTTILLKDTTRVMELSETLLNSEVLIKMNEQWKEIDETGHYEISSYGRVMAWKSQTNY